MHAFLSHAFLSHAFLLASLANQEEQMIIVPLATQELFFISHSASTLAQMVILKMHPQINASLATMALQDLILAAQRALEETIMIARAAIRMPSFPPAQVVNV
jgi:hypothetical protein